MQETLTFAVFAAGFVVRTLGGIIFGNIGDRFGRRTALVMGIITIAIPTAGIGLLPSYKNYWNCRSYYFNYYQTHTRFFFRRGI